MTARIGEPRWYDGDDLRSLYPGETAHQVGGIDRVTGRRVVVGYLVGPTPGVRGWWHRTRYRILARGVKLRALAPLLIRGRQRLPQRPRARNDGR